MLDTMPKPRKQTTEPKHRGAVLFIRLDADTEAALVAYIAAQDVEPDRSAVGKKALHEFLSKRGHWPPKPRA